MPTWKKLLYSGSDAEFSSVNIGAAEDSTYTDGLFTDFTEETKIGTAVDRFNEILKGLAPQAAPDLSNLESAETGENNLYLAFGAGKTVEDYENVAGIGDRSSVAFDNQFNIVNGSGGKLRLGVVDSNTPITFKLNENVAQDADAFENYPANAFNVLEAGGQQYTLEVNGTELASDDATGTDALNGTYFTLTEAQTGSFKGTGQSFEIFRHRTGEVEMQSTNFRQGWNHVRVRDDQGNITNYVDFVYDPEAAIGNSVYQFNNFITSSVNPTGTKNISGVKYYTGISYIVTGSVTNYYKNTYEKDNLSFSNTSANLSAADVTVPTPTNNESLLQVESAHNYGTGRILNDSLQSKLAITNAFGKTGNTGDIVTPTILLDNIIDNSTDQSETFKGETKRLPVGSYDTQADVTNATSFPSVSPLGSEDLAVYNGAARYPLELLNGGDIAGANITYALPLQPDYSSATGDRKYVRAFKNESGGTVANMDITINGTGTIVNTETALNSTNFHVRIKHPGATKFLDLGKSPLGSDNLDTDNMGCLVGNLDANISGGATNRFLVKNSNGGAAVPNGDSIVVEIIANQSFVGNISSITVLFQ